jgi:chromosome segregation ATPase
LLSTGLGEIVGELETARSRAETALNHVIDYTYKVMDVGQEVESSRSKLNKAEADSKILVDEAQKELNMSERRLAATLSKITDKENEIRTKTDEANGKRLQKNQLDAEILNKNQKIHDTERGVKRRKGTAAVSTVSCSCKYPIL